MPLVLIVDDEKIRHEVLEKQFPGGEYQHAFKYDEAVRLLSELSPFDCIYLDYDLRDEHGTGMSVAQIIIKLPAALRPKSVVCHSFNFYRRSTMARLLSNNGVDAVARQLE